ncbi:MAG: hypothetical protein ACRENE_02655 [Polyangiaceae bacterium]
MTETDEAERRLGRGVALGLPLLGVIAAVVAGVTASFGSAILVLASTAMLSTIALLWVSLRTLSGDAPLPTDLEGAALRAARADDASERKRRVLRALKDLENERALGKIDEGDYTEVAARYRTEAKDILREMEAEVAPKLGEAEKLAREYLQRIDTLPSGERPAPLPRTVSRVTCAGCAASNEPDATFCKGCGARVAGEVRADAKA